MPNYSQDPQTAPWCGEEHSKSPYEVMALERSGMFREGTIVGDNAKLKTWINQTSRGNNQETGIKFTQNQETLENTKVVWPKSVDWVEIWMGFDVDQSGVDKEIVVHYHRESRTIMSIRYNWNADLHRPYRTGVYFPVEHRWRGIGNCKMNEQFQREVTTQHRQRLDNATLANMRMFKVSKFSGYGPKEPIFPGKMWFLDSMDQLETIQLGDVYSSSYSDEQATLIYSQMRSGVNEATTGMPQVGTPGTATAELSRIQEGNKKFDLIFANFKTFTDAIIRDTAVVIQQFGPRKISYYETAENGQLVQQFFTMPEALVSDGLLLQFKAAGQQHNDIVDRQNWTQIAAFLQQYYTSIIQLAQATGDPQLLQMIFQTGLSASTEAMRQLLETFNIRNIDRLIVKPLETLNANGQNAANGTPRIDPNAAMALISQAFTGGQ